MELAVTLVEPSFGALDELPPQPNASRIENSETFASFIGDEHYRGMGATTCNRDDQKYSQSQAANDYAARRTWQTHRPSVQDRMLGAETTAISCERGEIGLADCAHARDFHEKHKLHQGSHSPYLRIPSPKRIAIYRVYRCAC